MRRVVAGLLLSLGLVLVPLGNLGIWTRRELLDTHRFTALSDEVLQQREVRNSLASAVTDALVQRQPALAPVRPLVVPSVRSVLGTTQFRLVFEAAVGQMHDQLIRGDDRLQLHLDPMLPLVRQAVARVSAPAAALIPAGGLPFLTVVRQQDAPALWTAVEVVRKASWIVPLAALLLLVGAVVASKRRWVMLIIVGVGVVLIAGALLVGLRVGHDALSSASGSEVSKSAFDAGWHTVTDALVTQTLLLGAIGAGIAGLGVLWGILRRAV